jgi:hypothetical protein
MGGGGGGIKKKTQKKIETGVFWVKKGVTKKF